MTNDHNIALERVAQVMGCLGVHARPHEEDGDLGVVVIHRDHTHFFGMEADYLTDPQDALDWATTVATLALGVLA